MLMPLIVVILVFNLYRSSVTRLDVRHLELGNKWRYVRLLLGFCKKEKNIDFSSKCQPKTSFKDRKFKYLESLSLQSGGGARAVG